MTILEKAYNTASYFNYPVFLQGSLGEDDKYPDTFITYWVPNSEDIAHYNNLTHTVDWDISIMFYTNDTKLLNTVPEEILAYFRSEGFIPQGKGNLIASDEPTHVGFVIDFKYIEIQK